MIRSITILALILTLGACGSKEIGQGASLSDGVKQLVASRMNKGANVPKATPFTGPTIQISLKSLGIKEQAVLIADQGGYKTYQSNARRSYTFNAGQLTATRGLNNDLMSRDVTGEERAFRFLTSTNGLGVLKLNCTAGERKSDTIKISDRSYNTQLAEEVCRSSSISFKSRVWRDGRGPRKAQQWAGPQNGFAVVYWIN